MKTGHLPIAVTSIAASLALLCGVSSASAEHKHHAAPGASVRHATQKANENAGTAKDVAPDSKQSATGGQPGGLPGHE